MATPNYTFWDAQDKFEPQVAAALCCDLQPELWSLETNPPPVEVAVMEKRLRDEVRLRTTDVTRQTTVVTKSLVGLPDGELRTSVEYLKTDPHFRRSDLRAWAKQAGFQPRFLFPELRKSAGTKAADTLSATEEKTALKIISALVERRYGEGTVADLLKAKSTRFNLIYDDVRHYFDMDQKTLRKYLKQLPPP